jgi:hypothetical protein
MERYETEIKYCVELLAMRAGLGVLVTPFRVRYR